MSRPGQAGPTIWDAVPTYRQKRTIGARYQDWRRTPAGIRIANEAAERALRLRRAGLEHYGIKAIAEAIRFDRAVMVGHDEAGYKLNNNFTALLAREVMETYPEELAGFFETRRRLTP